MKSLKNISKTALIRIIVLLVITIGAVWVDANRDVEKVKTSTEQESNHNQTQVFARSFIFNSFDNNKTFCAENSCKRLFLRTLNKFLQRHHNMQAFQLKETSIDQKQLHWISAQYIHFHQRNYYSSDGDNPLS